MRDTVIEKHDAENIDEINYVGNQLVVARVSVSSLQTTDGVRPPDGGWGWVVCFACFMSHVFVDGLFYSFGVVYVELLDYFKGSKGETAFIASLTPGVCFLVGPVVAVVVYKYGCRAVVVAGTFLSSGSLILSIFAPNIQFLYFSLGAMLGIGYGMIYLPSIVSVSHYFEKHRALATGIGVSGAGVGTFIFSPLTSLLIETYTWRGAILIQAGIILNCLACGLVYRPIKLADPPDNVKSKNHSTNTEESISNSCRDCPEISDSKNMIDNSCSVINSSFNQQQLSTPCLQEDKIDSACKYNCTKTTSLGTKDDNNKTESDCEQLSALGHCEHKSLTECDVSITLLSKSTNQSASKESGKDLSMLQQLKESIQSSFNVEIFRNISFCMFVVSTFFYSLGYYVPYVYLPDTAREAGVDDFKASFLLSTIGITNTIGRVVFGFLSDQKWMNRLVLYASALIICGVGTCFGPLLMTFELLLIYSIVFGVFSGVTISLTSVLLSDIVGIHKLADAFGVTNFFGGIGSFLGPPLAGWMYDLTGDYIASYITAGVAIFLSGAMLFFVPCIDRKSVFNKKSS